MPAPETCPTTPSRHSSGSSTNPNSPRSATPDPSANDTVQSQTKASPQSTSSSSDNRADIEPSWPQSIDVTKSAAVAAWGHNHHLSNLFFDLHWHIKSNKAFFKLRATVALASQHKKGRRDGRTSVYLFIHPERIRQLSLDDVLPKHGVEKLLGAETMTLRFELSRPPAMVLPKKESECDPKNKPSAEVLDALRDLACQTHFTVYARIPRRRVSLARMQELCAAASEAGRLASLEAHASMTRLYQGKGGCLIEGDTLPGYQAIDELGDDPPPVYDQSSSIKRSLEEPPPALFSDCKSLFAAVHTRRHMLTLRTDKGKKRQRVSTSPCPDAATAKAPNVQALLEAGLAALKKHVDEQLAAHKKEVSAQLEQAEARILDTLRMEINQQYDAIHNSVEERVQKEMEELEENVMRRISEMPLQARLTFPDHPLY